MHTLTDNESQLLLNSMTQEQQLCVDVAIIKEMLQQRQRP